MSSDSTDNRFSRDPELAQMHEALTSPDQSSDHDAASEADERAAATLLPVLDSSMLSPAVRRYVNELLIGGENPSPSTRQKLVEAANRGLRKRRADRAALPALLAFKREEGSIPVATLADALEISAEDIYEMESGRLDVRDLGAERIAKWVRAVRANPAIAVGALRHVLELSAPHRPRQAAGRRRSGQLSDSDQRLIEDVAALLDDTKS
jgi:hypothetical protein